MKEINRQDLLIITQIIMNMVRMYGFALLVPMLVSFHFKDPFFNLFAIMAVACVSVGTVVKSLLRRDHCELKHAYISLAIAWTVISLISTIPYVVHGLTFVDALFESFSGWTGTGLTMIPDPATLPIGLGFWRGFSQWVGGFGIVILALLLYEKPKTAKALFLAEGRAEDFFIDIMKIARLIVAIYVGYTILGVIALHSAGLSWFDAVINGMTSLATGGFSTHATGIGHWGRTPMIISSVLMVLGGISFVTHYEMLRGKWKTFWRNPEVRALIYILVFCTVIIGSYTYLLDNPATFDTAFYTISAITGTGATSANDLALFPPVSIFLIILTMISGACYGSTTGAIKLWRTMIVLKVIAREINRAFLPPNAILPLKLGKTVIQEETASKAISYIFLYITLMAIGSVIFMFFHFSLTESIFTVASAQGNVGLNIIPADQYFGMHPILKITLMFLMLVGRMEIIPFLVLIRSLGIVHLTKRHVKKFKPLVDYN